MAKAKSSKSTKPATKKGGNKSSKKVTKIVPAVKKENTPIDKVVLTAKQATAVAQIIKIEEKIGVKKLSMVKEAIDAGSRLINLKASIQKQHGTIWKAWAEANLPIGYPQISRYMKAAKNQALLEGKSYTSLEDALKLISFDGDEEKMAASGTSKKDKRVAADAAKVAFTPAAMVTAFDVLIVKRDVETITMLIEYLNGGLDKIAEMDAEVPDEDQDGEVDEDAAEAIAELSEANG